MAKLGKFIGYTRKLFPKYFEQQIFMWTLRRYLRCIKTLWKTQQFERFDFYLRNKHRILRIYYKTTLQKIIIIKISENLQHE